MASAVYCQVCGPAGSVSCYKSCTEGTVGELTDQVSALSIGDVWEGRVINSFRGEYNAGTAVIWAEDNRTKQRFLLGCVGKTAASEEQEYLAKPIVVTKDMVINCMTQAVA